jgi:4-deoxy-L-threo-5-hexosulose-uronate ketol-isomerase
MDIRYSANPLDAKAYDTKRLRSEFLIESLFARGEMVLVYSHVDRMITGSACPLGKALPLEAGRELGVGFFLERREMVALNLGGKGVVRAGGKTYSLNREDALYIGMGTDQVSFEGDGARFYLLSCPAHKGCPTTLITPEMAVKVHLGSKKEANERTINKYLDPAILQTCQLAMGMTRLEEGCVWNTMPSHTHERRMEVYLYLDLPEDAFVLHMAGEPGETRHIVVRDGQAVISPSWSIHSGVGTTSYTFVWGMCGENQTYDDMDPVRMQDFR